MQILERNAGDVIILDLTGRLTADDGAELFKTVVNRFVIAGTKKLLLNMEGITTIDSMGLGGLASKYVSLHNRGGRMKLFNVQRRSLEALTITKLRHVFEIYDSEEDAIKSFL